MLQWPDAQVLREQTILGVEMRRQVQDNLAEGVGVGGGHGQQRPFVRDGVAVVYLCNSVVAGSEMTLMKTITLPLYLKNRKIITINYIPHMK